MAETSSSSACTSDTESDEYTSSFVTSPDDESKVLPHASEDREFGTSKIVARSKSEIHEIVVLDTMEKTVGYDGGGQSFKDQQDTIDGPEVMRERPDLNRSQSSPFRRQARLSKSKSYELLCLCIHLIHRAPEET